MVNVYQYNIILRLGFLNSFFDGHTFYWIQKIYVGEIHYCLGYGYGSQTVLLVRDDNGIRVSITGCDFQSQFQ